MENKQFLKLYLYPLRVFSNNIQGSNYSNDLSKRADVFMSTNESLDLPSFKERARSVFGDEVEACNRYILYEKLNSINKKMLFFTVLAIASLVIGFLAGISFL